MEVWRVVMSCNPNVITIVSPSTTDVQGFSVGSRAVLVTAYGLMEEDTLTFKRVNYCSSQSNYKSEGCCLIKPTPAEISSAVDYQLGECKPMLSPSRSSLVIRYSGNYIPVVNNENSPDLTVTIEPIHGTNFTDKELGIEPCGFCLDKIWETTGAERCNQYFLEVEEISNCGNVRWTRTDKRCGYSASVPFPVDTGDGDLGGCCGNVQLAYMFHPNETRDPDASVAVDDCDGVIHGYIYPTAGDGHTVPVKMCNGDVLGYAVNNSTTSPQLLGDTQCR